MKKLHLLLLLPLLAGLVACGGNKVKNENGYYVDENLYLKFGALGDGWEKQDPGDAAKHGTIHFFFNHDHHARIWIRAIAYENDPSLPLREGAESYVRRKAEQYAWGDLSAVAEGFGEFNGEKSYWKIYEYKIGSKTKKEKIYRVYHNKVAYQFRLRCSKDEFDGLLPKFDKWLGTIQFTQG